MEIPVVFLQQSCSEMRIDMDIKKNQIPVEDLTSPSLEVYACLRENQLYHYYEPDIGIFIAESPKVIRRALDAGYEPLSFLGEDRLVMADAGETADLLRDCPFEVPVYTAAYDVLTDLTGFTLTRGLLCAMRRRPLPALEDLCREAKRITVLEEVQNPTNVGAIIRSAAAMHMDAVVLTHGCADPLYRRAARVSMGTVFQIPWTVLEAESWPGKAMEQLKDMGFRTAAMALRSEALSIDDPVLAGQEKMAVILGTEGEGLKTETIDKSDYTVMIPMSHGVDSLNVAAASAVAFWELRRK